MNDTELVDELRDLYAAEAETVRAPAQLADLARHREQRRRARRTVLPAASVLAAAVVAVVSLTTIHLTGSSHPGARSAPGAHSATPAGRPPLRAAYVERRIRAALSSQSTRYVVENVTVARPHDHLGMTRGWFDPTSRSVWTVQYDLAGRPQTGQGLTGSAVRDDRERQTVRMVDYRRRTWSEQTQVVGPIGPARPGDRINLASSSGEIRRALDAGRIRLEGRGVIDGYSALKVALPGPRPRLSMWIYATTFHPLRITFSTGMTATWYPRTARDAADADPAIPAHFRRVSADDFR